MIFSLPWGLGVFVVNNLFTPSSLGALGDLAVQDEGSRRTEKGARRRFRFTGRSAFH